jgi:4-hydroxybenzoate polyprenyltransferase
MSVRSIARTLHTAVAVLFVVGLIAQVWLAGRGVFESPTMFDTHRSLGYNLSLFTIALLVLGLLGGMGRRPAILAVVIFVLFILQSVFVVMRDSQPAVAALHPVNGFLILFLAIVLARDSWMMRTAPATA